MAVLDAGDFKIANADETWLARLWDEFSENLVAVNVEAGDISAERAIDLFEECGAIQVERAEGTWSHGEWSDFDPITAPRLIRTTGTRAAPPPA